MGKVGTLSGMIEPAMATGMVNVSQLADIEAKLKEVEKANDATRRSGPWTTRSRRR